MSAMDDASSTDSQPDDNAGTADVSVAASPPSVAPHDARSRADRLAALTFQVHRAPEDTDAWLHVVSGPSARGVTGAVNELATRFLAAGQRVLILDGGPRLALHAAFEREGRWGLVECLTGDMPVLGLVQDTGRSGLYLLAHGAPAHRMAWSQLGRLLDESQPHFGRAILALDPDAPAAVGDALAGWHLEGWWAERGRATKRAMKMADRLGIHFSDLDLEAVPEARLEVAEAGVSLFTSPADDVAPAFADAPSTDTVEPATGPIVLNSDPLVRERLRFLIWMRRVQSEERPAGSADPAVAADAGTA